MMRVFFRHDVYHAAGRRVVGMLYPNVLQVPSAPCAVPVAGSVAPVPIRAIPFTRASTTNLITATPTYRHDVYHPAGRRVVGMLYPNILQVPSVPCAVPIASPTASGVPFQTVTLGQLPSKMDRDRMYGFLTVILTIPAAEVFALRTNHHGLWFVDVSPWVASAFLNPALPPLDYTFSKNLNYVVKGGPLVNTRPAAFGAASTLQFRQQRMTVALTLSDPGIQCPTAPQDSHTSTLGQLPSYMDSDEWWPAFASNTPSDHGVH